MVLYATIFENWKCFVLIVIVGVGVVIFAVIYDDDIYFTTIINDKWHSSILYLACYKKKSPLMINE